MAKFKQFDLVSGIGDCNILVILIGPLDIPYFIDGIASEFSKVPINFQDPKEWEQSFKGYIVFNVEREDYEVRNESNLRLWEGKITDAYIPYDKGTGKLRSILDLIALGEK